MQVRCPRCDAAFQHHLETWELMFEEKRVKQEGRVRVAEEEATKKAQVAYMKRVREVAKEAKKTYSELSKARKAAEREADGARGATQRRVSINPSVIILLQSLAGKLTELENQSGSLFS